ncbi:hypothetical protein [Kineobactrum salinum]|uniref:Uncharacterized protein n=1 Tax=Kineobactrum salinum TaxID=2708301 RepID=A0A6C0U6F9_9GAMM|nr:hypothetical protein [Kineobactrum salinum]QIB67453.1 hypothetical protein G3T16_20735 [Kineobactrum salinum]
MTHQGGGGSSGGGGGGEPEILVPIAPPSDCINSFLAGVQTGDCNNMIDIPYEDLSGLDHRCDDGLPYPCSAEDFENTNLIEACRLNPTMPQCETTDVYDLCAHGGVPMPVIGCDYNLPMDPPSVSHHR